MVTTQYCKFPPNKHIDLVLPPLFSTVRSIIVSSYSFSEHWNSIACTQCPYNHHSSSSNLLSEVFTYLVDAIIAPTAIVWTCLHMITNKETVLRGTLLKSFVCNNTADQTSANWTVLTDMKLIWSVQTSFSWSSCFLPNNIWCSNWHWLHPSLTQCF